MNSGLSNHGTQLSAGLRFKGMMRTFKIRTA